MNRIVRVGLATIALSWPLLVQAADQDVGQGSSGTEGPSGQSSSVLQPTDNQSLQGADAGAGGINQPAGDGNLQSAGNQAQITDWLKGETESAPTPASPESATYFWGAMLVVLLGGLWLAVDRRPTSK